MEPISLLTDQGILNERIQKHLKSLPNSKLRNKYCDSLLDKKRHLIRLYNQCKQLSLVFDYKLDRTLRNLDLISIEELQSKLNKNIRNARASENFSMKTVKDQKKKAKKGQNATKEQRDIIPIVLWKEGKLPKITKQRRAPWITIVSAPM